MVPQETKCLQIQIDSETDDESLQVVARKVVDNVVSKVLDSQVEVHHKANEHGGDPDDKETPTKDKISWPIRVTVGLTPEVRLKVQQLKKSGFIDEEQITGTHLSPVALLKVMIKNIDLYYNTSSVDLVETWNIKPD